MQTLEYAMGKQTLLLVMFAWILLGVEPVSAFQVERLADRDLVVPEVSDGGPAAGKRVRIQMPKYRGTEVYHLLYLPTDWKPKNKYPVVVEYAGNRWKTSEGTVDGCSLGFGLSGGKGVIWICLPFVNMKQGKNEVQWWGDVEATVDYCKLAVKETCKKFGGDADNVFIAGFSRGAIACNYIGLHDDEIASLWRGFICHSHYDGVRRWGYAASDEASAIKRLARLNQRRQWISHENSVAQTKRYLQRVLPKGRFLMVPISGFGHTDTWVLHDVPERTMLRAWFSQTLLKKSRVP